MRRAGLVVFLLAAALWPSGQALAAREVCIGKPFTVTVLPNGTYLWRGELIEESDLRDRFDGEIARGTPGDVTILVDDQTIFRHVSRVVLALQLSGFPCKPHLEKFR